MSIQFSGGPSRSGPDSGTLPEVYAALADPDFYRHLSKVASQVVEVIELKIKNQEKQPIEFDVDRLLLMGAPLFCVLWDMLKSKNLALVDIRFVSSSEDTDRVELAQALLDVAKERSPAKAVS